MDIDKLIEGLSQKLSKGARNVVVAVPGAHLGTQPVWSIKGVRKDDKHGRLVIELDEEIIKTAGKEA